jgi:ubiquinone/menaquinone biosynthesis C-methylase UbiE
MRVKGLKDTIKWYDNNAARYAKTARDLGFVPAIDKFVSYLSKGARVLDAGCGSGRDAEVLRSKGFDVTGVDISNGLLEVARKDYPGISFVFGDLLKLPFPKDSFDGIWAQASLVHLETIEDTQKAVGEFYRVLKAGGIVHVFVKEQTKDKKTEVVSDKISNHDRFFQYYNKQEVIEILKTNGFKIILIENNLADPAGRKETKWIWAIGQKT